MSDERKIGNDIAAVALLTFIVFLVAALATYDPADPLVDPTGNRNGLLSSIYQPDQLVYPLNEKPNNACGYVGAWMSDMLIHVLGMGAYYVLIALVALEIVLFRRRKIVTPWLRTIGWMLSLIGFTSLCTCFLPSWTVSPIIGAGGYLGALAYGLLSNQFGWVGGVLLAISSTLIGMMMWTEYLVFRAGRIMFAPAAIAAASFLPFGLVHGFMRWFNDVEDEEEEWDEEDDDEEEEDDAPRKIRIRAGQEEIETQLDGDAEEEEDDEEEWEDEEETESAADELEEDEPASIPIKAGKKPKKKKKKAAGEAAAAVAALAAGAVAKPHFNIKKPKAVTSEREEVMNRLNEASLVDSVDDYELPGMDMLLRGNTIPFEDQKRDALKKADILERTCKEFGYTVNVVEVETGPVISQYEIQLEAGLRLNKITALADDLAIALRVPSVRIVAPIPGKNTVGVEVPNDNRQVVHLRDVMEQSEKNVKRMNVPLFLGKDAVGSPMVVDLAKMPHLLIAGRTGTGKSVCLNAIICSVLMTRRPDEVRMLMIDPKMVELSGYGRLPHLMHPVVTDMKKAEAILAWAVEKMEDRYRLLAKAGVRHINSYNELGEEELLERLQPQNDDEQKQIPRHMPFIVIVADEMADLMMTAGKEVETHIIRLAQKSRAVGIHLILATQKPTVDVITGLIKSNLPARLAFQVASKTDSRVVLDDNGADKLLGCGDMLFLSPGTSQLLRGQGTYLSDDEINTVTDAVSTGEQNFVHELVNIKVEKEGEGGEAEKIRKRDELYAQAVDVVVGEQRGSVSLLQRALGIGYGRAARLVDYMEEDGFVGPYNGSKSREVILTPERWAAIQRGDGEDDPEPEPEPPKAAPLTNIELGRDSMVSASTAAPAVDDDIEDDEEYEYEDDDEEEYEDDDAAGSADEEEYEDDDEEEYEDDDAAGSADEEEYEDDEEEEYEDVEDDDEYEYEEE